MIEEEGASSAMYIYSFGAGGTADGRRCREVTSPGCLAKLDPQYDHLPERPLSESGHSPVEVLTRKGTT
jgi:hypothetical protein